MKKQPLHDRTALTAIAAALALLSTPAMAQDATMPPPDAVTIDPVTVPDAPPPAIVPVDPPAAAPVVVAPPLQTVQSVPSEPEAQPTPARRAAPVQRPAPARDTAQVARTTAPLQPAARSDAAVPPPPVQLGFPGSQAPEPASAQVATRPAMTADSAATRSFWIIMVATILAVLASLASLAFLYRGDRSEAVRGRGPVRGKQQGKAAAAGLPAAWNEQQATAPVLAADAPKAVKSRARKSDETRLDAMVNAAPSADNPFLTHRNRVRRANFILAHGHAPVVAPAEAQVPATEKPAEKTAERERMVSAIWAKEPAKQPARKPAKKTQRSNRPLMPVGRRLKPATS